MARLPILMYHNVSEAVKNAKGLTISKELLERHFRFLTENNFTTFHLSELENRTDIPKKSVVITFDDVTVNQHLAVELLFQKYQLKATFFVPRLPMWVKPMNGIREKSPLCRIRN